MTNKTYFPTAPSIRIELALRCNNVMQHCAGCLLTERDNNVKKDIVADIARVNDIVINYMGFGSITDNDIEWLLIACDRMDVWYSKEQMEGTHSKFAQIKEGNN